MLHTGKHTWVKTLGETSPLRKAPDWEQHSGISSLHPSASSQPQGSRGATCTRAAALFELALQFNTGSAPYPGLWFKKPLPIRKLLF